MVERHLAKVNVASSNLVFRSITKQTPIWVSVLLYSGRPVDERCTRATERSIVGDNAYIVPFGDNRLGNYIL